MERERVARKKTTEQSKRRTRPRDDMNRTECRPTCDNCRKLAVGQRYKYSKPRRHGAKRETKGRSKTEMEGNRTLLFPKLYQQQITGRLLHRPLVASHRFASRAAAAGFINRAPPSQLEADSQVDAEEGGSGGVSCWVWSARAV
jgi:hypothetical protein